MNEIITTWQLVTPLFGGGAQPLTGPSSLRVPALRGALRFWLRAVLWTQTGDIAKVHEEEEALFGSADKGQGQVLLRLRALTPEKQAQLKTADEVKKHWPVGMGKGYVSYGLANGGASRPWVEPGARYELRLLCKPRMSETQRRQLELALRAFALFGGVGAKGRKGFGSLTLEGAAGMDWRAPQDLGGWQQEMDRLLGSLALAAPLPPYSAFSGRSRLVARSLPARDAWGALDWLGRELICFRSWGRNGKILGGTLAEGLFRCDHDGVLRAGQGEAPREMPKRAIFGLPHNYFFSSARVKVQINAHNGQEQRRASPLFFKLLPTADGGFCLAALLLAAEFLPPGMQVRFSGDARGSVAPGNDYEPIEVFLSRLEGQAWHGGQGWQKNQAVNDKEVRKKWQ